jgi:hypothetical protein
MTQFNKCEKACENKFKTDQELAFNKNWPLRCRRAAINFWVYGRRI